MKRKLVVSGESLFSYTYRNVMNDSEVEIFYSLYGQWAEKVKCKSAGFLLDDGNGVSIKLEGCPTRLRLDYDELNRLELLLKLYRRNIK